MWKKLNFANLTRENLAGSTSPTKVDFKSLPYEIPSLQFHDVAPRPQTSEPRIRHVAQASLAASSIYSQRSPDLDTTLSGQRQDAFVTGSPDISPPSSPTDLDTHRVRNTSDYGPVSPIEETSPQVNLPQKPAAKYGSSIPRPRTAHANTRWDAYSGEPTMSKTGQTGAYSPGNPCYNPNGENIPPSTAHSSSRYAERLGKSGTLAQRANHLASKVKMKPREREAWKSASGRTAIVQAVKDTPQESFPIPVRNPQRPSPGMPRPIGTPPSGQTHPVSSAREKGLTRPATTSAAGAHAGTVYTTAQPSAGSRFDIDDTGRAKSSSPIDDYAARMEEQFKAGQQSYMNRLHLDDAIDVTDVVSPEHLPPTGGTGGVVPVSRFSWSTHASSGTTMRTTHTAHASNTTRDDTEHLSTPAPSMQIKTLLSRRKGVGEKGVSEPMTTPVRVPFMPSRPTAPTSSVQQHHRESVLARGRPVPKDDLLPSPVAEEVPPSRISVSSRKPVGSPTTTHPTSRVGQDMYANSAFSRSSAMNTTSSTPPTTRTVKALPKAPGILSGDLSTTSAGSHDHVAELRAQLDDLSLRRGNLNKAIYNLTKAQAENKNPMKTDWRTAREAERRVEKLKEELAAVGQEEHEAGLMLHRAYKRREKEGETEGTSALWVRRVTG